MSALATTKLSSKGQVVIPEEIRTILGLEAGTKFVVMADGDTVILKVISPPSNKDMKAMLAEAHRQARPAGVKKTALKRAIAEARKRK